jgi:hypothetical protein
VIDERREPFEGRGWERLGKGEQQEGSPGISKQVMGEASGKSVEADVCVCARVSLRLLCERVV